MLIFCICSRSFNSFPNSSLFFDSVFSTSLAVLLTLARGSIPTDVVAISLMLVDISFRLDITPVKSNPTLISLKALSKSSTCSSIFTATDLKELVRVSDNLTFKSITLFSRLSIACATNVSSIDNDNLRACSLISAILFPLI